MLQHAADHPRQPRGTIVSAGIAAARWLKQVERQLAAFEPAELREQVTSSWALETEVQTEDEVSALSQDQLPSQPGRRGRSTGPAVPAAGSGV